MFEEEFELLGGSFRASGSVRGVSDFWDGSDEGSDFFAGSAALAAKLPAKMSMSELSAGHSGGFCKTSKTEVLQMPFANSDSCFFF